MYCGAGFTHVGIHVKVLHFCHGYSIDSVKLTPQRVWFNATFVVVSFVSAIADLNIVAILVDALTASVLFVLVTAVVLVVL